MKVVAYTWLGEEDVLIQQQNHKRFVIQRRRNLVPVKTEVRKTLQDAEKVYNNLLANEAEVY
jgi:hypothetical protein